VLSALEVASLVDAEVSRIVEADLRRMIEQLRIPPRLEERPWAYGSVGATFPCWLILEHRESDTGVAYSEFGFGPRCPWGLLWLTGTRLGMGDDSGWFATLGAAVRDSRAWKP
jgi:hypothetical protein